jgi:hypothetical protein
LGLEASEGGGEALGFGPLACVDLDPSSPM